MHGIFTHIHTHTNQTNFRKVNKIDKIKCLAASDLIAGAAETHYSQTSSSSSTYAMLFHQMLGQLKKSASEQQLDESHSEHNIYAQQFHQFQLSAIKASTGASPPHTASGPQCLHCGKIYSNASNLKQHVRNVHCFVDQSMWHQCKTCGKKLKTKHYLINHQLQAHGIHQRV